LSKRLYRQSIPLGFDKGFFSTLYMEFWNFVFYKLDYTQLILDVFTFGIYGALKNHRALGK